MRLIRDFFIISKYIFSFLRRSQKHTKREVGQGTLIVLLLSDRKRQKREHFRAFRDLQRKAGFQDLGETIWKPFLSIRQRNFSAVVYFLA